MPPSSKVRVLGAGLPRTATASLRIALQQLLGGSCHHMSAIPGHPFNLGPQWKRALDGDATVFAQLLDGYSAAVDWPTAAFWRELIALVPMMALGRPPHGL